MADQYYIEQGYFTPDGYFVYTADASADITATATVAAQISVIKSAAAEITATATIDATAGILQEAASDLSTTTTLVAQGILVDFGAAQLSSSFVFASSRYLGGTRPQQVDTSSGADTSDQNIKYDRNLRLGSTGLLKMLDSDDYTIKSGENFIFEVWWRKSSYPTSESVICGVGLGNNSNPTTLSASTHSWAIVSPGGTGTYWSVKYKNTTTTFATITTTSRPDANAWQHLAFRRIDGTTLQLLVNNTVVGTASYSGPIYKPSSSSLLYNGLFYKGSGGTTYFDEASFQVGANTVQGYTEPILNDPSTHAVLQHFDGNFDDDISVVITAASTQTVSASLAATARVVKIAAAAITANSSVSATISNLAGADLFAFSDAQVSVTADRLRSTDIAASSEFNVTADYLKLKQAQADLTFDANLTADILSIVEATADLATESTETCEGTVTRSLSAILTSTSTLSATISVQRQFDLALSTESTITATATKTARITEDLSAITEITAIPRISRDFAGQQTTTATTEIIPTRIRDFDSVLGSESTMVAAAARTRTVALEFSTVATTDTLADRFADFSADLSLEALITAIESRTRNLESQLLSLFSPQVSAVLSADRGSDMQSTATMSVSANAQSTGRATLVSQSTTNILAGLLIDLENNSNSGIGIDNVKIDKMPDYDGPFYQTPNLTLSIWYRLESSDTDRLLVKDVDQLRIDIIDRTSLVWTAKVLDQPDRILSWPGSLPDDLDWHHIQVTYVTAGQFGNGLITMRAWVDDTYLGQVSTTIVQGINLGWGPNLEVRRNTAQVFLGELTASQAQNLLFYPYRDLDTFVAAQGDRVWYYHSLDQRDHSTLLLTNNITVDFVPSTEALFYDTTLARAEIYADLIGVLSFLIPLPPAEFQVTAKITGLQQIRSLMLAESTLTAQAERLFGDILPQISAAATVQATATRITPAQAQLAAESTLTAEPTSTLLVAALFASSGSLDCTVFKISPLSTEFSLETSLSAQALKIKRAVINIDSAMTATIAVTEITGPVGADLTAEFLVTCESIVFSKIAADLTTESTLLATATRRQPAEATITATATISLLDQDRIRNFDIDLEAFNTTVTVAKIIHIVLALTLPVRPETRLHQVDPETRLEGISRETRIKLIDPETRSLELEPESRQRELFGG